MKKQWFKPFPASLELAGFLFSDPIGNVMCKILADFGQLTHNLLDGGLLQIPVVLGYACFVRNRAYHKLG
jgi:hypothetical protein